MNQESRVESRESKTENPSAENENLQTAIRDPQTRIPLFTDEPQTLAEIFLQAQKHHNRPDVLNYKRDGEWQKISSDEMVSRAENIALGLYSLGLRKGDRAAILAANSPEWTLSDAGCQFAGIIDVPDLHDAFAEFNRIYFERFGRESFVYPKSKNLDRIEEIFSECKELEKIVFFDAENADAENSLSLEELENAGAKLKSEKPNS